MNDDPAARSHAGTPRVLLVHAHPDDETITTGGTIADFSERGAPVRVVTCTLGEEGEVLGEELEGLVAGQADQLGGYRIAELRAALRVLGAEGPKCLGGVGRWRDSGMAGTPAVAHPRAFASSGEEAVAALVQEIEEFRPDLVVTYDPGGGYGHPDHIHAHRVTRAALGRCTHPVRRLAWTVTALSDLTMPHPQPPAGMRSPSAGELPGYPDSQLTHRVRLDAVAYSAKLQALAEHATQLNVVSGGDNGWFFALTNGVLQPIPTEEWFISFDRQSAESPGTDTWTRCPAGFADLLESL